MVEDVERIFTVPLRMTKQIPKSKRVASPPTPFAPRPDAPLWTRRTWRPSGTCLRDAREAPSGWTA